MAFKVLRLDAIYTAPFGVPALTLVGRVSEIINDLYRTFTSRYSFVRPDAFRALGSNTLSEVGVAISFLDRRLEITLRVDQLSIYATNLRNPYEIRFAQDCALLMHSFINSHLSDVTMGVTNLRVASWLMMDGGKEEVSKILNKVAKPGRTTFDKKKLGAGDIEYWVRIFLKNEKVGWQLSVGVEPSAISDTHLYILRDYIFDQTSEIDTAEKKMAFLESSALVICEWLGIEPAVEAL
jgi:hypothetical protein